MGYSVTFFLGLTVFGLSPNALRKWREPFAVGVNANAIKGFVHLSRIGINPRVEPRT